MKKLICTNPKNYKLTLNKEYLVVVDEEETILLVNDNNKTVRYYKDLFQEIEEEIEVVPEPEPIPRTEQDLIDSITNENLQTTYINFNDEKVIIDNYLSVLNNENDFSCGIKNIVNISDQICEIYEIVEKESENFEEDLPLLTKALIKQHLKNRIKHASETGFNAGIYLMSCNVTNGGLDEEVVEILNEITDFHTESELNPNSGNQIMLWGFYKSNL